MDSPASEIHQVGSAIIHLRREKMEHGEEHLALLEGGGVCIANSFASAMEADEWLRRLFRRIHPSHHCGLGCVRLPGYEFLASDADLEALAGSARRSER